jgi:hypothetical protein
MIMRLALITLSSCLAVASAATAGTVTGVAVAPTTIRVGGTVAVTVTGTNPCGAANINYGDATVITYAITGLPVTQTHPYDKAGTYTITARGMGNCDGEATTTVTVTPPPPAPPQAPAPPPAPTPPTTQITAVEMAPNPVKTGEPITLAVKGTGTCAYEVHYGDGNVQEVNGQLPQQFRHTYSVADKYTVIVKPTAPCTGRFTQVLQVLDTAPQPPRLVRMLISPTPVDAGQPVSISVEGSGTCAYTIDFGDGNDESRSSALPDRVRHVYSAAGSYTLAATAAAPCSGTARGRVDVRRRSR